MQVIDIESENPMQINEDYNNLQSLIILGDELIVGAEKGRLYTFDVQGIDQSK